MTRRHAVPEPANTLELHYLAAMQAENMSPETIRQRLYLLRGLGKHPDDVTIEDVWGMLNGRRLSVHSRAAYVSVLKTIYGDLLRLGLADNDPTRRMKTPKTPRRLPRPLPKAEIDRLLTLPKDSREYAWTVLGLYAGLRAGEVVDLTGESLIAGLHGPVLHVIGKGQVEANIPAHPKVQEVLRPFRGAGLIWPMWPYSLDRAWVRAAESVGVTGRVFHQLRHSFATRLVEQEVPLLVVADVCRHASVATTQRYAQVASSASARAVAGL